MWPGLTQHLAGRLVVLEPLAPEHEPALAEAARDPRTWRWMQTDGSQPERFRAWFERTLANAEAGTEGPFATVAGGRVVGSTRFLSLRPEHRGLEIGYTWLHPDAWGTGVNTEAKLLQ